MALGHRADHDTQREHRRRTAPPTRRLTRAATCSLLDQGPIGHQADVADARYPWRRKKVSARRNQRCTVPSMTLAKLIPIAIQLSMAIVIFCVAMNAHIDDVTALLRKPGLLVRSLVA